jgi:DNA-binding beta-propeller fold protein YncE
LTKGNLVGTKAVDLSGQLPSKTTRRDSHGMVVTLNGKYVHTLDRIQNTVEVFDAATYGRSTYDLTTFTGTMRSSYGRFWTNWLDRFFDGPCGAASVQDDPQLPKNDPAPDLSAVTPDGDYILVALRGPVPVSVPHGSQGSCPGIGVVKMHSNRKHGRLVQVIRTTNTLADSVAVSALTMPGGHPYQGKERSDIHQVTVVPK